MHSAGGAAVAATTAVILLGGISCCRCIQTTKARIVSRSHFQSTAFQSLQMPTVRASAVTDAVFSGGRKHDLAAQAPLIKSSGSLLRRLLGNYYQSRWSSRSATMVASVDSKETANDLKQRISSDNLLPRHPGLHFGTLENGLRYCIFPNKKPSGRFYANLEVHAGSVDELEHERGLAHYLEHVLFLGTEEYRTSKAMKKLFTKLGMGFNADANAYTDFRSTIYTLSAPIKGNADKIEVCSLEDWAHLGCVRILPKAPNQPAAAARLPSPAGGERGSAIRRRRGGVHRRLCAGDGRRGPRKRGEAAALPPDDCAARRAATVASGGGLKL